MLITKPLQRKVCVSNWEKLAEMKLAMKKVSQNSTLMMSLLMIKLGTVMEESYEGPLFVSSPIVVSF
jgi:hypothetical protein